MNRQTTMGNFASPMGGNCGYAFDRTNLIARLERQTAGRSICDVINSETARMNPEAQRWRNEWWSMVGSECLAPSLPLAFVVCGRPFHVLQEQLSKRKRAVETDPLPCRSPGHWPGPTLPRESPGEWSADEKSVRARKYPHLPPPSQLSVDDMAP